MALTAHDFHLLCSKLRGRYLVAGAARRGTGLLRRCRSSRSAGGFGHMAFYERGWSGINIEPLDEYFDKLNQARPRDTNLKVAVGREAGVRELHAFPGTGLSTLDPKIGARHHAAAGGLDERLVPVLTLTKILEDCAPADHPFSEDRCRRCRSGGVGRPEPGTNPPWIIVIEANEPNSHRDAVSLAPIGNISLSAAVMPWPTSTVSIAFT